MKKISMFVFLSTIILLVSGCAVWKDLNTPVRRTKKRKKIEKPYEPKTLPDGSTLGLNKVEKQYMDDIDSSFNADKKKNSKKVFGY